MEYFSLGNDPRLETMGSSISFPERVIQGFEHAEEIQTAIVKPGRKQAYCPIIERPVLLVSEEIQQLLARFAPDMKSKTVHILNPNTYSQDTFCMLDIPEIDCMSLTHSVIEKGVVKKLVISEKHIENYSIFKVKGLMLPSLIVRLDVAEALMRTSLYGLKIQRISTEGDVNNE